MTRDQRARSFLTAIVMISLFLMINRAFASVQSASKTNAITPQPVVARQAPTLTPKLRKDDATKANEQAHPRPPYTQNVQPVIGIVTLPAQANFAQYGYTYPEYQFVRQNYVWWVEQAGAKAVPVPFDADEDYLRTLFAQLDGLLWTGGDLDINIDHPIPGSDAQKNIFTQNSKFLIDLARESNDNGVFFPVWGTCQGFELLAYIGGGLKYDVLQHVDNDVNQHRDGQLLRNTRLFAGLDEDLEYYAATQAPLFYWHELCVPVSAFNANEELREFYKITAWSQNATTLDEYGALPYVAAIEAYEYPFYAVQFHPEITQYEWGKYNTNKEEKSVRISQYLGNFFSQLTRRSTQKFRDENVLQQMMFDYKVPVHFDGDQNLNYFFKHCDFPKLESR